MGKEKNYKFICERKVNISDIGKNTPEWAVLWVMKAPMKMGCGKA